MYYIEHMRHARLGWTRIELEYSTSETARRDARELQQSSDDWAQASLRISDGTIVEYLPALLTGYSQVARRLLC